MPASIVYPNHQTYTSNSNKLNRNERTTISFGYNPIIGFNALIYQNIKIHLHQRYFKMLITVTTVFARTHSDAAVRSCLQCDYGATKAMQKERI